MAFLLNEMLMSIDWQELTILHRLTSVMPTSQRQLSIWKHQIFEGRLIKRNADVN